MQGKPGELLNKYAERIGAMVEAVAEAPQEEHQEFKRIRDMFLHGCKVLC